MIKKILNNAYVFSVVAKIFGVLSGIIYSILYSRYLGAELRGVASIVTNYAEMLSLVLCLGVFQAYPYFKMKYKKNIYLEYINNVSGLFVLYSLIIIGLIAVFNLKMNIVIALIIAPIWMCSRQFNYVVLIENPKKSNLASIKLDIFDIVTLSVLLVFTKANYFICIVFLVTRQVVYFFITFWNLDIKITKIRPTLKAIMPYIKYGILPMLTIILMEVNYKVDVLMLEWFNISVKDIGIYSLGVMLAQKLWMIPDALKDILLSKLTQGKGTDEVEKISRISFSLMTVAIIIMIILGKPLICILYGKEYIEAYPLTLIILCGVLGMVFYKMIYSYNVVNGHKRINFILLAISAVVNVIINALLIPALGSAGAAVASLISYLVCGISFLVYFCKITNANILHMMLIQKEDIKGLSKMLKK